MLDLQNLVGKEAIGKLDPYFTLMNYDKKLTWGIPSNKVSIRKDVKVLPKESCLPKSAKIPKVMEEV